MLSRRTLKKPKTFDFKNLMINIRQPSTMSVNQEARSVLDYWFGPEKNLNRNLKIWFSGGEKQDQEIREKFGKLIEKARGQELESWKENSKTALAHILLIDQFCRNIYRGSKKSFDCDHMALDISKKLVAGDNINHKELNAMEKFFAYMPFQHSENLDDQETSCQLYAQLDKETIDTEWSDLSKNGVQYAVLHREIIQKYGRFPKRNAVLGRANTPEEEELLRNYPYYF